MPRRHIGYWDRPSQPGPEDCQPLVRPAVELQYCNLCGGLASQPLTLTPIGVITQLSPEPSVRPSEWQDTIDVEGEIQVCHTCLTAMDVHPCVHCLQWILADQDRTEVTLLNATPKYIHDDCIASSDWFHCADCDRWTELDQRDRGRNADNEEICARCAEQYCTCARCEEVIHTDDSWCAYDSTYCESCFDALYTSCHNCGEPVALDEVSTYHDDTYCEGCYQDLDLQVCADCGNVIDDDDSTEIDGDIYCTACARRHRPGMSDHPTNRIHSYDLKPQPIFHGLLGCLRPGDGVSGKGKLFLGVELEIHAQDRSTTIAAIGDQKDERELYLKRDGSLSASEGVELVSHPCTLVYHQTEFGWQTLLSMLGDKASSHDNGCCGLHVHLSRDFFPTELDECKLGVFIYTHFRATGGEAPPINRLARRGPGHYCASSADLKDQCSRGQPNEDHYDAVNYGNRDTIEIRCARGTLREVSFLGWLEFCDAAARWVCTVGISTCADEDKGWKEFKAYVNSPENCGSYANLITYMAEKGV